MSINEINESIWNVLDECIESIELNGIIWLNLNNNDVNIGSKGITIGDEV